MSMRSRTAPWPLVDMAVYGELVPSRATRRRWLRREIKIENTFLEHNNKYFELQERRLLFQVVAVRGDSQAQRAADMQQVLGMRVLGKGGGLDWVVWDFKKLQSKLEYKAIHHPLVEEVRDTASFTAERQLSAVAAGGGGGSASGAGASGE